MKANKNENASMSGFGPQSSEPSKRKGGLGMIEKRSNEGVFKPGERSTWSKCPKCKGKKTSAMTISYDEGGPPCPKCHGLGKIATGPANPKDHFKEEAEQMWCSKCNMNVTPEPSDKSKRWKNACPQCGNSKLQPVVDEDSMVGAIGGFNGPKTQEKKMREIKTLTKIIREVENPGHGVFTWKPSGYDLSKNPKSLTSFIERASKSGELQKQFDSGYNPDKFFSWLQTKVEEEGLNVSAKYLNKMYSQLLNIGQNAKRAMNYIYNADLKGAALGLTERTRKNNENL